ncbi:MAG: glycosyltransferase [Kiritimatiellia bacterium]|nr:glycosyltransferase [Kiritimatiellia bacterium]
MRIFTVTPKPFLSIEETAASFFSRDTGLLCHGLRRLGVDSRVVLLSGSEVQTHPDVLRASMEEMQDVGFWKKLNLDGVVLYAWLLPEYRGIVSAIRNAGVRVIARADSTGLYDPRTDWVEYLREAYWGYGSERLVKNPPQRALRALLKTGYRFVNRTFQRGVVGFADGCHALMVESTVSGERMKKFFSSFGRSDLATRVHYVPHAVAVAVPVAPEEKENRIIAIGRWADRIKNAPLLVRTLGRVLQQRPGWTAQIIGSGEAVLRMLRATLPEAVQEKIEITGRLSHAETLKRLAKTKILLVSSRMDSFNMAAAEALCMGCSVVGGSHLPSFAEFVSNQSGAIARSYTARGLAEAVQSECALWQSQQRDALGIATASRAIFQIDSVAFQIRKLMCDPSSTLTR